MKKTSRPPKRKKSTVGADTLLFTLSDLEEDRKPSKIVVNKLSKDRQRVLRQDANLKIYTTDSDTNTQPDAEPLVDGFVDLANIDVDAVTAGIRKANKSTTDDDSRKQRYISSVSPPCL